MTNDRTMLITGSTGFVGSALAYRVLFEGGSPILLARPTRGISGLERIFLAVDRMESVFGKKVDRKNIRVVEGDVTLPRLGLGEADYGNLLSETDAVLHSAALVTFDGRQRSSLEEVNVGGVRRIIDFCGEARAVLHHLSTAFVCGRTEGEAAEEYRFDPPAFRNDYERTKWEAEGLVHAAIADGAIRGLVYRPSIILGDRACGFTSVFSTLYRWFHAVDLLRKSEARRSGGDSPPDVKLRFPVDPDGVMSIVPIDYVADGVLHIARSEEPDGRIFHLVTRNVPANRDHLELVLGALGARGITLMSRFDLPEERLTGREKRIVNAVTEYRPYFDTRIEFDDRNTTAALASSDIEPPHVDRGYIDRIITFARDAGWGRHQPRLEAGAARSEKTEAREFFTRHLARFIDRPLLDDLKNFDAVFTVALTNPIASIGPIAPTDPARDLSRVDEVCSYTVRAAGARISAIDEGRAADASFVFLVPVRVFLEIASGREDPREAFFAGKTDITGDLESALAVIPVLKRFFEEYPYEVSPVGGNS